MVAAITTIPVIGVPIESKKLKGLDSLLSIVQIPKGIPIFYLNDSKKSTFFSCGGQKNVSIFLRSKNSWIKNTEYN